MTIKTLAIPRVSHPLWWIISSLVIVLALGTWGLLFPDARAAQISLNIFVNEHGNRVLNIVALAVEKIFSPLYAIGLTAALAVIVWIFSKSLWTAVGFGLAVAAAWLPVEVFKLLFNEPRPDATQLLNVVVPSQVDTSFPSGHVSFVIGLVYALLLLVGPGRVKTLLLILGILAVVITAYARIYAGVHYLSDDIGSVFTSILGILIFQLLWPLFMQRISPRISRH